jgi:hypothetical protein
MISNQAFFNKVKKHLLRQKRRARLNGHCVLFVPRTGDRCALGCAIPIRILKNIIKDSNDNTGGVGDVYSRADTKNYFPESRILSSDLRECHDTCHPSMWAARLHEIADRHNLKQEK